MSVEVDTTGWKTPANMLVIYLADQLEELIFGTNLFVSKYPDAPDSCVCVYDQGGPEQTANIPLDTHFIQVLTRDLDYTVGYNLANKVKVILQSAANIFVETERIVGIWVTSNIVTLKPDAKNRNLFSCNFRVIIETNKDANRDGSPLTQVIGGGDAFTEFDNIIG